ncbi:tetratricopeptide repeat protein [Nitzschia inconspicua]|uniref:Tetratricopeptide repeat protein n=1 Tax=Nitzschia inconspicua TaxID=303405 RepID=A0A9K3LKK8_9STRA|nr:tetratricopeptide repeat protein [Nitzschia inconspicua]
MFVHSQRVHMVAKSLWGGRSGSGRKCCRCCLSPMVKGSLFSEKTVPFSSWSSSSSSHSPGTVSTFRMTLSQQQQQQQQQSPSRLFSTIPLSTSDVNDKDTSTITATTTTDADVFGRMHHMALTMDMTGKWDQAEVLYKECMKQRHDILGATHDDTLTSVSHLAAFFYKLGRFSEAEPLFERLVDACKSKLGPTHAKTIGSVNNLAYLNYSQGKIDKAESLFRHCLQELAYNPHRLLALQNLGSMLALNQRYEEAEPIYQECLDYATRTLGDDHIETKTARNNLALLYRKQNNVDKAIPLYEKVLDHERERRNKNDINSKNHHHHHHHPDILSTLGPMGNLAALYCQGGRYQDAERMFLELLPKLSTVLGENHPNTLQALLDLGTVYYEQAKYVQAEPLYLECMERTIDTVGMDHPITSLLQERWMDLHYHMFFLLLNLTRQ